MKRTWMWNICPAKNCQPMWWVNDKSTERFWPPYQLELSVVQTKTVMKSSVSMREPFFVKKKKKMKNVNNKIEKWTKWDLCLWTWRARTLQHHVVNRVAESNVKKIVFTNDAKRFVLEIVVYEHVPCELLSPRMEFLRAHYFDVKAECCARRDVRCVYGR